MAVSGLPSLFDHETNAHAEREAHDQKVQELYAQIGRLSTQVEWLKKKSGLEPD
jgi:putative transposase